MNRLNIYLKIVIFILLLVFLATFLIHKINLPNDDLGRHIKTGQIIWQTQNVPKINLFSYAEPNHPFINHHWLSELIFYWFYAAFGFSGLVILKLIILLLAFAILYYLAIQRSNFWWATLFGFLCLLVFIERTDVRPEIFSYLFLSLFFLIFYLYSSGKKKFIWWLIPLQLIWVNLHIYFFLGPFLVLIFFIQQLINQHHLSWLQNLKRFLPNQPDSFKELRLLGYLTISVFAVLLINPNFIKGAAYPLFVLYNYGYDIVENKSPFYLDDLMNNPAILHFKILISLIIVSFVLNHRRTSLFDFLTGLFAIFLGWFALRNLPLTALLALPILAVGFKQSLDKFFSWLKNKLDNHLTYLETTLALIVICFLILISYASLTQQSKFVFAKSKTPGIGLTQTSSASAEFYLTNKIQGPVLNNFDIGSYLDFYLYPEQTFVDNRPEAFTSEFWQYVYIPALDNQDWWQVFDQHYQFNSVFFGHNDITGWANNFTNRILNDPAWVTVYIDQHAFILVKDVQKNQALIDQFAIPTAQVMSKIDGYRSIRIKVDQDLQQDRIKGLKYIRQNFGNIGSL